MTTSLWIGLGFSLGPVLVIVAVGSYVELKLKRNPRRENTKKRR